MTCSERYVANYINLFLLFTLEERIYFDVHFLGVFVVIYQSSEHVLLFGLGQQNLSYALILHLPRLLSFWKILRWPCCSSS